MPEELKLPTTYETWLKMEGLAVIRGYFVDNLRTVPVEPWARLGGRGTYIDLEGSEQTAGCYVCEIPPGSKVNPEKHLYEELIFVLSGRGATTVWKEGGPKQTFEWQAGSLFSPPLNTWHQHFNGQGDKPTRFVAMTNAAHVMNLFHNLDFIFNDKFVFSDRFDAEEGYFSGRGKIYTGRIWDTNFIPDVNTFQLLEWKERGAGGTSMYFELSNSSIGSHASEFGIGKYKKAHRHGPGAHVIILSGTGFSLMWPEGSPWMKFDWHVGSLIVPPDMWFHQHFNTGKEPARYLALSQGSQKFKGIRKEYDVDANVKAGGSQIEYEDEDPEIRRLYVRELAKHGEELRMPPSAES